MIKQEALKPQDIAVALRLAEKPEAQYADLGSDLGMSVSTAHKAVERLQSAGLLRPGSRAVNKHFLIEFLEHGVRYAFPAQLHARAQGIPTAYSSPALADEFLSDDKVVWPTIKGSMRGHSISPLYPNATELVQKCPSVYEMLTLVDALRIGRARERGIAIKKIKERLAAAV